MTVPPFVLMLRDSGAASSLPFAAPLHSLRLHEEVLHFGAPQPGQPLQEQDPAA